MNSVWSGMGWRVEWDGVGCGVGCGVVWSGMGWGVEWDGRVGTWIGKGLEWDGRVGTGMEKCEWVRSGEGEVRSGMR